MTKTKEEVLAELIDLFNATFGTVDGHAERSVKALAILAEFEKQCVSDRTKELEDILRSAHAIALRQGEETHWKRFAASIQKLGIGSVTARTYRIVEGEELSKLKSE